MEYLTHRRFRGKCLGGEVNLPAGTACEENGGVISHNGTPICFVRSENAHQYFARNDDGNGMLRGKLTQSILNTLRKHDDDHQNRWDKVWGDETCQAYKRKEQADFWLWNHEFYNGEILVLRHIATLVGAK